jgi:ABC-type lipoprotein export system ATPase subunit
MAHLVHEQGRAGIIVTHDLRMVEFTDRIVHLLDGRLERIVSPDDDLSCLADPASCQMIDDEVLGVDAEKVAAAVS